MRTHAKARARGGAPDGAPRSLFADALSALEDGTFEVTDEGGAAIAVDGLALADFHVLRAVMTHDGVLTEDPVEIACGNCGAALAVRPCAGLEVAPWEDGELGDEELDTTLPFGEPIEIPTVALGRVRTASTVTFAPRTVGQARNMFEVFAKEHLEMTGGVVEALGIAALGNERDPAKIADALGAAGDEVIDAITDAFLASHYVLRLGCVAICEECGARNDVDAPYVREMEPVGPRPSAAASSEDEPAAAFPTEELFAERASEIAEPIVAATPGAADVEIVIEDGTPAVDDGGEPLLGSYVPPHEDAMTRAALPPTVTIYYRTFRAMWDEDGPYDWEEELRETIEHELEHHVSFLRGDDPTDDAEREEIRDEVVRIVGKKETTRRAVKGFGESLPEFFARTWPIWLIAAIALAMMLATQGE